MPPEIHIIGGGTVNHVRPHLAICAPAYGKTARLIEKECKTVFNKKGVQINTHLTKMADPKHSQIETNADVKKLLDEICANNAAKVIFLPVALCDFEGHILNGKQTTKSGKEQSRLKSREGNYIMQLTKADKLIANIKQQRPDIVLIGFKTTSDVTTEETITLAKKLQKDANCDFVFANDIFRKQNLIIGNNNYTSEIFKDRALSIKHLTKLVSEFI